MDKGDRPEVARSRRDIGLIAAWTSPIRRGVPAPHGAKWGFGALPHLVLSIARRIGGGFSFAVLVSVGGAKPIAPYTGESLFENAATPAGGN